MATTSQTQSPDVCPRINKWFGSCEFRPRYDSKPILPDDFNVASLLGTDIAVSNLDLITRMLGELKQTTYVQDVCVTCGRVVKREVPHG